MERRRKKARPNVAWRHGRAYAHPDRRTDLATLARDHLEKKTKACRTSASHLADLEHRLGVAVAYFGPATDPRSIVPDAVRGWAEALAEGGRRKPGTVRHYLNALSGLFRRAQEGLYVEPGYNPVAMMQEKPTGRMVRDLRKSLDAIGALCGMEPGALRTRSFRHTYCSARLQTVQRIVRPGCDPSTDPDPYEWVEVSRFQVQKEMGHGGAQLVDRIYGHAHRAPHRSEVVEYRVERHRAVGDDASPAIVTLAVNNDVRYGSR